MTMPKIVTIDEKTLAGNPWLTKYIGDARQVQVPEMVTDADGALRQGMPVTISFSHGNGHE